MKESEKVMKSTKLVLAIGELLDEHTKGLGAQESFEIVANVCMQLTSYPIIYITRETHEAFIHNFLVGARNIMEKYSAYEAAEQETGH